MQEGRFLEELHKIRREHYQESRNRKGAEEMQRIEEHAREILSKEGIRLTWQSLPSRVRTG